MSMNLAFLGSAALKPDNSVSVLSSERYVRENYAHIVDFFFTALNASGLTWTGSSIQIVYNYGGTDVWGMYTNAGSFSGTGTVLTESLGSTSDDLGYKFSAICNPITVKGIHVTKAGSWQPIIQPGVIWRSTTISAFEPPESWLIRAGLETGDQVLLCYTVPEASYGTQSKLAATNSSWPTENAQLKTINEFGIVESPYQISTTYPIVAVKEIKVDDKVVFTGEFDNSVADNYIRSFNSELRTINLKSSLDPDSKVEVQYYTYSDFFIYSGYRYRTRTADYNWYPFDANPEYGHIIGDPDTDTYRNSGDCLIEQSTIYLQPSMCVLVRQVTGGVIPTITFTFYSAFNYDEVSFVRHSMGTIEEDFNTSPDWSTTQNAWGIAVFSRNYYDQPVTFEDDVFNKKYPSMIPIGRILLTAPTSLDSLGYADTRSRGGGVPLNPSMSAIHMQKNGLDTLRGFYDLGPWIGAGVQEGGVIEIRLDNSILDEFTEAEVDELVRNEIHPGIYYTITYVDGV